MLVAMEWKLWVLFSPCDDMGLFCTSGETIQHISGLKDEDNALKMNALLKALVNKSISNEFVKKDVFVPHNEDTLQQEERQKWMLASDDGNGSEDVDDARRLRSISGDGLSDSFSHCEDKRIKRDWIEEILHRGNASNGGSEDDMSYEDSESAEDDGDEEETDEYEKTQLLKDCEQSGEDNLGTDLEEEDGDRGDEDMQPKSYKKASELKVGQIDRVDADKTEENGKMPSAQLDELPYVIAAPTNLEEFSAVLENRSDTQIVEAIRQIRTCNVISVAAENRKKMQRKAIGRLRRH